MPDPLAQSVWLALSTGHTALARSAPGARRYPEAVAPFGALDPGVPTVQGLRALGELVAPGETVYIPIEAGAAPPEPTPRLEPSGCVPCLQMVFPAEAPLFPRPATPHGLIEPLTCADAPEMLALIAIAFPGYFRAETCRMGDYVGIRDAAGVLIAMGGERFCLTDPATGVHWREISGLCTHPAHTGRGHSTRLMAHLIERHRARSARSWLHVVADNTRAINLYHHLGFETLRRIDMQRLVRPKA